MSKISVPVDVTKRRIAASLSSLDSKKRPRFSTGADSPQKSREGAIPSIVQCRPWSSPDFLARLETFKIHLWRGKPESLGAVRCAMHGWINSTTDTIKCPCCSSLLIIRFPQGWDKGSSKNLIRKYIEQLTTAHNSACPWIKSQCQKHIYSQPLTTTAELVNKYQSDVERILSLGLAIPVPKHTLNSSHIDVLKKYMPKSLPLLGKYDKEIAETLYLSAAILTLFGWRADCIASKPTLKCEMCFRVVGLWMFKNHEEDHTRNDVMGDSNGDGGRTTKEGALETTMDICTQDFDAEKEHRSYCYWINRDPSGSVELDSLDPDRAAAQPIIESQDTLSGDITLEKLQGFVKTMIPGWQREFSTLLTHISRSNSVPFPSESRVSPQIPARSNIIQPNQTGKQSPLLSTKPKDVNALTQRAKNILRTPLKPQKHAAIQKSVSPAGNGQQPRSQQATAPRNASSPLISHTKSTLLSPSHPATQQASALPAHQPVSSAPTQIQTSVTTSATSAPTNAEPLTDELFPSLDLSGLSDLLGGSNLASALEDPDKAQAILNYVKGLLKSRNESL